jgi:hypothetical protein
VRILSELLDADEDTPETLAEGHLTRRLFGSMLRMIAALPLPNG